jgi:hypothetical protein
VIEQPPREPVKRRLLERQALKRRAACGHAHGGGDRRRWVDPMCGLIRDPQRETPAIEEAGVRYSLCSDDRAS